MFKQQQLSKFIILLILSFSSFASTVGPMKDQVVTPVIVSPLEPGFEWTASALFLQPSANNLGWGVVTTVFPLPSPIWHVMVLHPDYQLGFNLGGRYIFPNIGVDTQLNWWHLDSHDIDAVRVNPANQWISPFSQTGTPPTNNAITGVAQLKLGRAEVNFDYDAVNFDLGKFINLGSDMQMRIFSGLTSARIKEELLTRFQGYPQPVIYLNNTSTFTGIGPRLGLNNSYDFYRGINLVGQLAGSILVGRLQPGQYKLNASAADLLLVGITNNKEEVGSLSSTHLVPEIDAKLGLDYIYSTPQGTRWTIEIGYMGALYINSLTTYETNNNVIALDTGSLSSASIRHTLSNFSVGGPYVTVSMKK